MKTPIYEPYRSVIATTLDTFFNSPMAVILSVAVNDLIIH